MTGFIFEAVTGKGQVETQVTLLSSSLFWASHESDGAARTAEFVFLRARFLVRFKLLICVLSRTLDAGRKAGDQSNRGAPGNRCLPDR